MTFLQRVGKCVCGNAAPMPGLPIAGANSTIGDPYEYGKFQNFLPDIKAEGQNDMATGLRPHMFNYTKPNPGGGVLPGTTLGDSGASDIQGLRDQLAALTAQISGGGGPGAGAGGAGGVGWGPFEAGGSGRHYPGNLFVRGSPSDPMPRGDWAISSMPVGGG